MKLLCLLLLPFLVQYPGERPPHSLPLPPGAREGHRARSFFAGAARCNGKCPDRISRIPGLFTGQDDGRHCLHADGHREGPLDGHRGTTPPPASRTPSEWPNRP